MKKLTAMLLAGVMAASLLVGCGSTQEASTTDASTADASATAEETTTEASDAATGDNTYTVGICQLVQHVALDAATQGFKDALTDEFGDAVTFDEQNAQGDSNTCSTIINSFVSNKVDLILANATPALQAAQAGTDTIPVLGTSVTDYASGLDLADFNGTVGGNISGTSDLAPLDGQADMLHELCPDAKTWAIPAIIMHSLIPTIWQPLLQQQPTNPMLSMFLPTIR